MQKTCLLAFGTRGDIQPLVFIVKLLCGRGYSVTLVTHYEHSTWIKDSDFNFETTQSSNKIKLVYVETESILHNSKSVEHENNEQQPQQLWSKTQQLICINACIGSKFILFNLFALEGLVIADVLGIPSVALHPYPPPKKHKCFQMFQQDQNILRDLNINDYREAMHQKDLVNRLNEEWPNLLNDLRMSSALEGLPGGCLSLSFEEFSHWVWPIVVSPHWMQFRTNVIQSVSSSSSSSSLLQQKKSLSHLNLPLHHVKVRAPLLLYGHSPLLLPNQSINMHRRVVNTGPWCMDCQPINKKDNSKMFPEKNNDKNKSSAYGISHHCVGNNGEDIIHDGIDVENENDTRNLLPEKIENFVQSLNNVKVIYVNMGAGWEMFTCFSSYMFGTLLSNALNGIKPKRKVIIHFPNKMKNKEDDDDGDGGDDNDDGGGGGGGGDDGGGMDVNDTLEIREKFYSIIGLSSVSDIEASFINGFFQGTEKKHFQTKYHKNTHIPINYETVKTKSMKRSRGHENDNLKIHKKLKEEMNVHVAESNHEEEEDKDEAEELGEDALLEEQVLFWRGSINHIQFLKYCAVVVHHGGSGTTLTSALSSVPQVPLPLFFDQFEWAQSISELGIGPSNTLDISPLLLIDANHNSNYDKIILEMTLQLTESLLQALSPQTQLSALSMGSKLKKSIAIPPIIRGCTDERFQDWQLDAKKFGYSKGTAYAACLIDKYFHSSNSNATFSDGSSLTLLPSSLSLSSLKLSSNISQFDLSSFVELEQLWLKRKAAIIMSKSKDIHFESLSLLNKINFLEVSSFGHHINCEIEAARSGVGGDSGKEEEEEEEKKKDEDDDEDDDDDDQEREKGGVGVDDKSQDLDVDWLELPNRLWIESIGHEETAFLYDEIFVKQCYAGPTSSNSGFSLTPSGTSPSSPFSYSSSSSSSLSSSSTTSSASSCRVAEDSTSFITDFLVDVQQSDVVLDCGANIGMFSIWLHNKLQEYRLQNVQNKVRENFKVMRPNPKSNIRSEEEEEMLNNFIINNDSCIVAPQCRIICVEPSPNTASTLRRNLKRHVPYAIIIEAALVSDSFDYMMRSKREQNSRSEKNDREENVAKKKYVKVTEDDEEEEESEEKEEEEKEKGNDNNDVKDSEFFNKVCDHKANDETRNLNQCCWGVTELLHLIHLPGNSCLVRFNDALSKQRNDAKQKALGLSSESKRIKLFDQLYSQQKIIAVRTLSIHKLIETFVERSHVLLQTTDSKESKVLSRISLLKVDVEGAEYDILSGINKKQWNLIDRVVVEVHELTSQSSDISNTNFISQSVSSAMSASMTNYQYQQGNKSKIDQILRHVANFDYICWDQVKLFNGEQEDESTTKPSNWMVYASRKPFKKDSQ